jgi:hypothetical protein
MAKQPVDLFAVGDYKIIVQMDIEPLKEWRRTFHSLAACIEWIDRQIVALENSEVVWSPNIKTEMTDRIWRYKSLKQRIVSEFEDE